jgi:ubiquinone/menaquinone biosynthesis C-methylase UbiE
MSASQTKWGPGPNAEAITAWDGPLFDRFVRFREIVTTGLGGHGEAALRLVPPRPGQRVLDIGCGFGDTTQRIAGLVGPTGEAVGVDAAARFIETARKEAEEAGVANARFLVADVQSTPLGDRFDLAFSRFGTMFFTNPVVALRNVRRALAPGGTLVMVVWRQRTDNDWLYRAQTIVEGIVSRPEEYDDPTCGPGPFSMANADTTSEILVHAGFEEISLRRCDIPILIGRDVEEAIQLVMARSGRPGRSCGWPATGRPTCTARCTTRCAKAWPSSMTRTGSARRRRLGSSPRRRQAARRLWASPPRGPLRRRRRAPRPPSPPTVPRLSQVLGVGPS